MCITSPQLSFFWWLLGGYCSLPSGYCSIPGGYCSLPLGTAPFHIQYERTQHTPSNNNNDSQFPKNTTFQRKLFKLNAGVTKEISKLGFLSSFEFMFEVRRYVKYYYLPALNDQLFMSFTQSYQSQKTRYTVLVNFFFMLFSPFLRSSFHLTISFVKIS